MHLAEAGGLGLGFSRLAAGLGLEEPPTGTRPPMIGPAAMLWLALILSPTPVGEAGAAPTIVDGTPTCSPALDPSPCWALPSPPSRREHPLGAPRDSLPATESESEPEPEEEVPGGGGPATTLAIPVGPPGSAPSPARPCTSPPGRSGRPVTRLRC
jgi:hypothetical protein